MAIKNQMNGTAIATTNAGLAITFQWGCEEEIIAKNVSISCTVQLERQKVNGKANGQYQGLSHAHSPKYVVLACCLH
jgi:hypothetical protein